MPTPNIPNRTAHPAVVVVAVTGAGLNHYLQVRDAGSPVWVEDPQAATTFDTMREAMRTALRLPARLKAFGLPRPLLAC